MKNIILSFSNYWGIILYCKSNILTSCVDCEFTSGADPIITLQKLLATAEFDCRQISDDGDGQLFFSLITLSRAVGVGYETGNRPKEDFKTRAFGATEPEPHKILKQEP